MNKHLYQNPTKFLTKSIKRLEIDIKLLTWVFFTLTTLTMALAAATAILTAIVISKLFFGGTFPVWFFFAIAGFGAASTLAISIINYFNIRMRLQRKQKQIVSIKAEKIKYDHHLAHKYQGADKDYRLYLRVASILGNHAAKKEVTHA